MTAMEYLRRKYGEPFGLTLRRSEDPEFGGCLSAELDPRIAEALGTEVFVLIAGEPLIPGCLRICSRAAWEQLRQRMAAMPRRACRYLIANLYCADLSGGALTLPEVQWSYTASARTASRSGDEPAEALLYLADKPDGPFALLYPRETLEAAPPLPDEA